jgi:PAS domain S-box-containing protein
VWTEIVAVPLVDADGRMTELLGVTRDIRERKRYEDTIRQSEQRLRLLLDSFSQIAVQGFTPDGTINFWNQANEPLYGYTAGEALGQDLVEFIIAPEQRPRFREIIHQMARSGERPPAAEYSVIRKDGQRLTVYANHAVIDVPGSGRELYCIDIDLTGLRQTEEQLRISEERHRLLADHALDVIWTMGLDGTFHYMSPSIERLRGYTAEEVRRMPLEATFTPASWAIVQEGLGTARAKVQSGLPVDFRAELEELRKDGSIVWTDVRATGIYGSDGRFIELLGVTRDISERKRYERELEAARTAAEAAARARSEFLANMSHEIRTPMNGVLGLAQLLEHEPLTPDQRAMVKRLGGAGRTLIGILNDILDFSKIEAGELQIDRHPFALAPLLERLDSLLGDTARGKGLALRFAAPTGLAGGLVGDDLRLEQILLNLVGNAIKFTAAGEVRVQTEPVATTETEIRLRFEVWDSGVGIAPEVLPTLFNPFTQADGSITRRFGGTGLGLSIARRLVELMGGTIGAESTPGQGSCFWFELPFARTTDPSLPGTPGAPDQAATGPRLTGLRLLVVDDSSINQEVVARILKREGAEVVLANDGQQALDVLREHPSAFDAVLMDVQMPVMDGLTAARRVRGELGLTTLPVIAFTAGVLDEERDRAQGAGFNGFLAKPVDLEQMVSQLRQWVGPRPVSDPPSPR